MRELSANEIAVVAGSGDATEAIGYWIGYFIGSVIQYWREGARQAEEAAASGYLPLPC